MTGDWSPASRLRPGIINILLTTAGAVHHVGVGFDVISPNGGVVASRGWTWDPVPGEHQTALEAAMVALVDAAVAFEGLAGVVYEEYPTP